MNTEALFAPLLDLLLKSAVLILLGTALLAAFRKISAANRHAVSTAIFAALLLLPFTKLMPPRWSLALEKKADATVTVRLPLVTTAQTTEQHATAAPVEIAAQPASHTAFVIPWKTLALSVWLAGAALLFARRAFIALRLRAVVRCSDRIEDERLAAMARELVAASGVRAAVRESSLCRVPLVAGVVRPVVLLPADARDWSDALISSALRHELGHIRRRDCITRLLADAVCALYWLNPLVWFAARALRLAQEQACDDVVLNSGACADEYAGHLVDVVRSLQGDRLTARHALAMAQPSTLETRVLAIVDATRDRSPRSIRGALAGFTFVTASLALCTAAQLRGADDRKPAAAGDQLTPRALVEIEAKFIEISGEPAGLPDALKLPAPKLDGVRSVVLTAEAMQAAVRSLNQKKGVDILSAPRVTTLSKQRAIVEVVREFKYPTEWDKDAKTGKMTPTAFEKRDVGVTFEVTTQVNADGTINLVMAPQIVEFEGYVPFNEAAEKAIPKNADGSPVRITSPGTIERPQDVDANTNPSKVVGKPDPSMPRKDRMFAGPDAKGMPQDAIWQPVFHTRKISTEVTVQPGRTVVLGGMDREDIQTVEDKNPKTGRVRKTEQHIKRRLFVLVTARIVQAKPQSLEIQSDSITLDKKTGTVSAKGNVKIETAEAVVTAAAVDITPKKAAPEITFPKVDFRDATLRESVDFLVAKSKGLDPAGNGVNIVLKNADKIGDTKITLSLSNVPLEEVLKYVAALASCEVVKEEFAFVIQPQKAGAKPAAPNAPEPKAAAAVDGKPAAVKPEGTALKKAEAIIFPKIDFRDATLAEAVDFLRGKAKTLGPDKNGVNVIVIPRADAQAPRITVTLANVPLSTVFRYVAELAGYEITADDHTITLRPAAK